MLCGMKSRCCCCRYFSSTIAGNVKKIFKSTRKILSDIEQERKGKKIINFKYVSAYVCNLKYA